MRRNKLNLVNEIRMIDYRFEHLIKGYGLFVKIGPEFIEKAA
jgi:hypothetical protein